ncbi:MAG: hypothetical protein R3D34_05385 [Nitratireductor sp.]|nr:hypothetical protein [Nitratireductor sp.]
MNFFGDIGRVARNGLNRMVEARERQARRYVNATLLGLDDETLARSGFDRKQLEKQGATHSPF